MLFYLILVLQFLCMMCVRLEFTSIKCTIADITLADNEICLLKAINRTYRYISIKTNLHKPINDFRVNVDVRKRANGYKPFLYNVTSDICNTLRGRSKNKLLNFLFQFLENYSNINHTCPYNHSLILEKFSTDRVLYLLRDLPVPFGEYGIFLTWMTGKVVWGTTKVFAKLY